MLPNNPQAGLLQPSCFLTSLIKKSPDTPERGHSQKCVPKVERLPGVGCLAVPPPSGGRGGQRGSWVLPGNCVGPGGRCQGVPPHDQTLCRRTGRLGQRWGRRLPSQAWSSSWTRDSALFVLPSRKGTFFRWSCRPPPLLRGSADRRSS